MTPVFFETPAKFRAWLSKNAVTRGELLVGFYKADSGRPSMTWSQSVDQALCFGWIDGVRRSIDGVSYSIRFTPRKPGSIWSTINIRKVDALIESGAMKPAGQRAFDARKAEKSSVYSHERTEPAALLPAQQKLLDGNHEAAAFFAAQAPSYQRACIHWVITAKREETKVSRLAKLIAESNASKRVAQFTHPPGKR